MTDAVEPNTTGPSTTNRTSSTGRLTFAVTVEDLGSASFIPFLLACGLVTLSPLGEYILVATLIGFIVILLGAQLIIRRPVIFLPDSAYRFFHANSMLQSLTKSALRWRQKNADEPRHSRHWVTVAPFDQLPRCLLVVCGFLIMFSSPVPNMQRFLGIAVIVLTISLHARRPYWLLSGALLISLATISPLFGG